MSVTQTPEIVECCKALDPCKALCLLQDAELQLALGKTLTAYKIGEESFTYKKPSLSEVRTLIGIYEERCNASQCKPMRRRGGGQFRYSDGRMPGGGCPTFGRC